MATAAPVHAPLQARPEMHISGRSGFPSSGSGSNWSPIFALPRLMGNHAFGQMLEGGAVLQRKCACGGTCSHCKEEGKLHRKEAGGDKSSAGSEAPSIVHDVLRSPGQPLDRATRGFMEPRFGEDFSSVRVHTDSKASESARAVNALAYTVGPNVVFVTGQFAPETDTGKGLLAHELTHVVQQRSEVLQRQPASPGTGAGSQAATTPTAGPTCSGGLQTPPSSGFWVCSRSALGFNHAFIVAPPFTYGLIKRCRNVAPHPLPLVTGADIGLPLNPTAARTSDHSPDPCGKPSQCCECRPKPGITDLGACFRRAFSVYPSPSNYVVFPGPNSNTFGKFMATACCQGMESSPPGLGLVPGWGHSPASSTQAVCPVDLNPNSCDDPPTSFGDRLGQGLRGMVAYGLLGAAGGALTGAAIGAIIGSIVPGLGTLIGAGIGAAWGAGIGGAIGGLLGLVTGLVRPSPSVQPNP